METRSNAKLYYLFSILCGTWFLITSWVWVYLINLFISYPVGLIGIFLWNKGRQINPGSRANLVALVLHVAGFVGSIISLLVLYFYN